MKKNVNELLQDFIISLITDFIFKLTVKKLLLLAPLLIL
jgi:hypothetical protein